MQEKILVIDDEEHIVELLRYNLKKEGFRVYSVLEGVLFTILINFSV